MFDVMVIYLSKSHNYDCMPDASWLYTAVHIMVDAPHSQPTSCETEQKYIIWYILCISLGSTHDMPLHWQGRPYHVTIPNLPAMVRNWLGLVSRCSHLWNQKARGGHKPEPGPEPEYEPGSELWRCPRQGFLLPIPIPVLFLPVYNNLQCVPTHVIDRLSDDTIPKMPAVYKL